MKLHASVGADIFRRSIFLIQLSLLLGTTMKTGTGPAILIVLSEQIFPLERVFFPLWTVSTRLLPIAHIDPDCRIKTRSEYCWIARKHVRSSDS